MQLHLWNEPDLLQKHLNPDDQYKRDTQHPQKKLNEKDEKKTEHA